MKHDTYIMMHSGALVGWTGETETPTLGDLTLGMSRTPRFAGQTRVRWSVLDHSLFAASMAQQEAPLAYALQLAVLLHDAHEALTGDVPTPFKSDRLRGIQMGLDAKISSLVCLNKCGRLFTDHDALIKMYDLRALRAEALVVASPMLTTPELVAEHFGAAPEAADVENLKNYLTTFIPRETKRSLFAALVEVLRHSRDPQGNRPGEGDPK
jgi:hypothetical protein